MKEKHHNSIFRRVAFCAITLATLLLVGCGGGGGGGGVGNRGGDSVPPVLKVETPAKDALVSDVDFRTTAFRMTISYTDSSSMDFASLRVTLKLDNGTEQNATSYFRATDGASISSNNIYTMTRAMLPLVSNDTTHTITVGVQMKDAAQNLGQTTSVFTVYPVGPPSPQ